MRDYDNIPVLDWKEDNAAIKAKAQIMHQEPLVLQMPDNFDTTVDDENCGCKFKRDTGILYDCDGGKTLHLLARQNHFAELNIVVEACIISSSQVDIDSTHNRIVVHD